MQEMISMNVGNVILLVILALDRFIIIAHHALAHYVSLKNYIYALKHAKIII